MEKSFLLHSPKIVGIEVVKRGKVSRARLYYLKGKTGKAAKVKEYIGPRSAKK
ncbi:50S ribosomal protein L19 [Chlamydia abortus]|nr:50S ribosomal protein L19 [Chlamydia abortus]